MSCCSVRWCGKNSRTSNYKTDGITFHRFPKEPEFKQKWIEITRRENWFPREHSVICSRHFTDDCFLTVNKRRHLFRTAIPTQHLPLVGNTTVDPSPTASASSHIEPISTTQVTIKLEYTDSADSSEFNSPTEKGLSKSILEKTISSEGTSVDETFTTSTLQCQQISNIVKANQQKASDLDTPTVQSEGHILTYIHKLRPLSEEHTPQNSNPTASPSSLTLSTSIKCEPLSDTPRKVIDPETLSEFNSPTEKRLSRHILDLKKKVTIKNKTIKVLRNKVRRYKKKVESMKWIIKELQKKCPINTEDADLLKKIGVLNKGNRQIFGK